MPETQADDLEDLKETCTRIMNLCAEALGGTGVKSPDDLVRALKEMRTAECILEDLVVKAAGVRDQDVLDGLYKVCRTFATHIQEDGLVKVQTLPVTAEDIQ